MPVPTAQLPYQHPVLQGLEQPRAPEWFAEDIAALDWYRLAELLRAVAANARCQLGPSRVSADGSVQFAMLAQAGAGLPQRTLVRLAAWNDWSATPKTVDAFAWELGRIREPTHGVLVAPAGATPAASARARELGVEVVDADKLCRTLESLSPEQSTFFKTLTLNGDATTPTCPICLNRLTRVQQGPPTGPFSRPAELIYQVSTVVPEPVDCDRLEVLQGCEVTFLHEVRARREVVIQGHVSGDFVCQGKCTVMPGATLVGSVAAQSVDIRAGGELQGQSRIIDSVTEPITHVQPSWFWRCQHPSSTPECRRILFEPHS